MGTKHSIEALLNGDDLELVLSGIEVLEALVADVDDLFEYVPCRECISFEELQLLFSGEHRCCVALWILIKLAELEMPWVASVTELDLSSSGLTMLPDNFEALTQLRVLNLSNNSLTELPENFGELAQLTTLHLRNNQLSTIPKSFERLTHLRQLTLKNNRLTSIPEIFALLSQL